MQAARPLRPLAAAGPRIAPRRPPARSLVPNAVTRRRRPAVLTTARATGPRTAPPPAPRAGAAVWDAVDVLSTLGAVAGALAFVATQEALLLAAPATLPLLALFAARRRQRALLAAAAVAAADAAAADTDAALEDLRSDVAAAARAPAGALRAVDAKLAALEDAVDKAAGAARAAAAAADGVGAKVSRASAAALADAVAALRRDAMTASSSSTALAPALDSRLAAVETALSSLSAAQAAAAPALARAVAGSLDAAVADIVDAVRDEVGAALASVRQGGGGGRGSPARGLAPGALDAEILDDAPDALPPNAVLAAATPAGLSPSDRDWLEERLRSLAAALDGAAARRDTDAADALAALTETAETLAARDPVAALDPDQWGALGRRLSGLEAGLEAVAGRPPPDVGPLAADVAALRAAVEAMQSDVTAAVAAESTRGGEGDAEATAAAVAAAVDTALAPVTAALDALRARVDAAAAAGDAAADAVALLKRVEAAVVEQSERAEKERDTAPASTPPASTQPTKDDAYAAMQDLLAARNPGVAERVAERNEAAAAAAAAEAAAAAAATAPAAPRPSISAWLAADAPTPEPAADPADSIDALVARGKAALRDGRALLPRPGAEPAARRALDAAAAAFEAAAGLDPASVTALGNWGNALAARGALEATVAAAAAASNDPTTAADAEAAAEAAWVAAGDCYRRVAELAPSDGRALANWARALAARAGLARSAAAAERLLESAAAKLDAVLAANPRDARAARDAGIVLVRLAGVKPAGSAAERDALRDGLAYLADARAMGGGGDDDGGEAEAAAERAAARLAELGRGARR